MGRGILCGRGSLRTATISLAFAVLIGQIAHADPRLSDARVATSSLPAQLAFSSAVYDADGGVAYIFGGYRTHSTNCTLDQTTNRETCQDWGPEYFDDIFVFDVSTSSFKTSTARLPTPRRGTSAVWDGRYAYIFGGWDGDKYLRDIVRFDSLTQEVSTMGATLPSGREGSAAVWDGRYAYLIGGVGGTVAPHREFSGTNPPPGQVFNDDVIRFDPLSDAIETVAQLPSGRGYSSAVYRPVDSSIYLFGGYHPDGWPWGGYSTDQWEGPGHEILRIGPVQGQVSVTKKNAVIAYDVLGTGELRANRFGRYGTAAAIMGDHAYIFGGCCNSGTLYTMVSRYDFVQDRITPAPPLPIDPPVPADKPVGRGPTLGAFNLAAAGSGSETYLFGGNSLYFPYYSNQVLRYTPAGSSVTSANLPYYNLVSPQTNELSSSGRSAASAVWANGRALILGGDNVQNRFDQIVEFKAGPFASAYALTAKLKERIANAAVVWDPRNLPLHGCPLGCIHVFGGFVDDRNKVASDKITKISMLDDGGIYVSEAKARLPEARFNATAVFDGRYAYIFGGEAREGDSIHWNASKKIIRYDPDIDSITTLSITLPDTGEGNGGRRAQSSSVWARHAGGCELGCAYIFGGKWTEQIVRFTPELPGFRAQRIEVMPSRLDMGEGGAGDPAGIWGTSAVWDGRYAYIFGGITGGLFEGSEQGLITGYHWGARAFDQVLQYDPLADAGLVSGPALKPWAKLPTSRYNAPAVCGDDGGAYVFGGGYSKQRLADGRYYRRPSPADWTYNDEITHVDLSTVDPVGLLDSLLSVIPKAPSLTPIDPSSLLDTLRLNLKLPCKRLPDAIYKIYAVTEQGEQLIGEVSSTATARAGDAYEIVTDALACAVNSYRVKVHNAQGIEVAESSTQQLFAADPPRDVVVERVTSGIEDSVAIRWSPPARCGEPLYYRLYRLGVGGAPIPESVVTLTYLAKSYLDFPPSIDSTLGYQVTAIYERDGVLTEGPPSYIQTIQN